MAFMLAKSVRLSSVRTIATTASRRSGHGGTGLTARWRNASLFIAFPACLLGAVNAFWNPEHEERLPFKPYEHMYIRTSKFPWGDGNHSLFHNKERNALPEGYEEEEE